MINYLLIHSLLTGVLLVVLRTMANSPPRLRMWLAVLGMVSWLIPLPLFRPALPANVTPGPLVYTLSVFGAAEAATPTPQTVELDEQNTSKSTLLSWKALLLMAILAVGIGKWLFQRRAHHRWLAFLKQESVPWPDPMHPGTVFLMPGSGAMTTGIFHKKIWMGRDHFQQPEWQALLTHEQTHLKNHDNLLTEAIHLLECLLWWNPAALFLGQQARFFMELSCDQTCIRILDRYHYQHALAVTLHRQLLNPIPFAGLVTAAKGSNSNAISRLKFLDRSFQMNQKHSFSIALLLFTSGIGIAFPTTAPPSPSTMIQEENNSKDVIARVGQSGVTPPVFIHKTKPVYPERAAKIKLQGYVIAEAVLRKDGTVEDIQILRGLGKGKFGFEDATIDALRSWTFKPGEVNGIPADVRMTLKIDFVLGDQDISIPLLSWKVPGDPEASVIDAPPKAIPPHDYFAAQMEKRNLSVPVVVELDPDGQVTSYTPDAGVMSQLLYPDLVMESLEELVQQTTWNTAVIDGIPVATVLKLNLAIALGDPETQR